MKFNRGGATYQFFTNVARRNQYEYWAMKKYWEGEGAGQLVTSVKEGIRKVREDK